MLPENLRGDGPCTDCETLDNPVWFTDNTFWNEIIRVGGSPEAILCINCFIVRAYEAGYRPSWRLLPEWRWQGYKISL